MEASPVPSNDEMIPCEICEQMVQFSEYLQHLDACMQHFTTILLPLPPMQQSQYMDLNITSNQVIGDNDTVDQGNEQSQNIERVFIVMSFGMLGHEILESSYDANLDLQELMGGNVEVGLSNVDAVILRTIARENDDLCVICQELLCNEDRPEAVELLCHHKFCDECIRKWLSQKQRCPVCMVDLEELPKISIETVRTDENEKGSQEDVSDGYINCTDHVL